LSAKVNAQVEIGNIQAEWNGLKPSLVVDGFRIQSHEGQTIVVVDQARMRFDLLKSLRNARLVWSSLSLQRVGMDFIQTDEGFWRIAGLPEALEQVDDAQRTDLNSLIDTLLLSRRIELQNSRFRFAFANSQQMLLDSPSVLLENAAHFHRLTLQIDV